MKLRCRPATVSFVIWIAVAAGAARGADETARDISTRLLLDALEERQYPDVMLLVLDRIAADPAASATLKQKVPFLRGTALVGISRTESDAAKRTKLLDDAEGAIDAFLKVVPAGRDAIDAYSQKGNLLIERGRAKLEEAKRPGADAKAANTAAVSFFDAAIKALQGSAKPDVDIKTVTNAEDAAVALYRQVRKQVEEIKAGDKDGGKDKQGRGKPTKRSAADELRLEQLEDEAEVLQTKIVQTRLMVAGIYFEKAKAFAKGSKEWEAALDESTKLFAEIAKKYPTRGGGFFAKYYEGRNLVVRGKYPDALAALGVLTAIDDKKPIAVLLRSKALNSSLECWIAQKKFDDFTDDLRKFALTALPVERLDADWLGLKYRAAQVLVARADALGDKDKSKKAGLLGDANKLAADVARANRDFGKEARELLTRLGKSMPGGAPADSFDSLMDDVRAAMTTLQAKQAEAKQAAGPAAEQAKLQAAAERDRAVGLLRRALKISQGEDDASVNQARYLLTYLLYEARRFHEAATLGTFLAERYPNAKGSRQAAKIAMACWQQLQSQTEVAWAKDSRSKTYDVADLIVRTWPAESESSDASVLMAAAATEAGDVDRLLAIVKRVPKETPRREEVLQRVGTAVLREVGERRRQAAGGAAEDKKLAEWKAAAKSALDEGLAAVKAGPSTKIAVAAALSRCQVALEEGDLKRAGEILEHPIYGPWTVVRGKDPAFTQGPLAEGTLTVALRYYIQAEKLDKAQQAMDGLEKVAGEGEQASAKLTNLYFAMGRDLQSQLEELGAGGKAGSPEVRARADAILGGFEKFLDGLSKRDRKVSSQMWVATTYLTLGSGQGTGAVVSKARAEQYLDKAAAVFDGLLKRKAEGGGAAEERQQIEKFEPAIRLKMAKIYGERGKWAEADQQMDWILADPQRQNSLDAQIEAAELCEAAGRRLAAANPQQAEAKFREATAGRKSGASVVWGWGIIANKLTRQAFSGADEKALKAREQFFDARFHVASCLFERGRLQGKSPAEAQEMLKKAQSAIGTTYKLYPELGGEATRARFEKLLKEIQKALGAANPGGLRDFEPPAEPAAAASASTGG